MTRRHREAGGGREEERKNSEGRGAFVALRSLFPALPRPSASVFRGVLARFSPPKSPVFGSQNTPPSCGLRFAAANISPISPFRAEIVRIRSLIGSKWSVARKGLPHEVQKHAHVRGSHMRMLDPVTCACSTPSHAEGVGRVPREGISRSQPGPLPFPYWVSTRLVPRTRPVSHSGTRRGAGYKPCSILQNNGKDRSPLRPAWDIWPWRSGEREEGVSCVGTCLL